MNESKLYAWLAYLGAIPFLLSGGLIFAGHQQIAFIDDLAFFANSYGLVIVVFMSGIHWGQYLSDEKAQAFNLLLISNVIALTAWFTFILATTIVALAIYGVCFVILLLIDAKLASREIISNHYFRTRCIVTGIVIMSLLITIYSLMVQS